jgi:hypothetical protein
VLRRLASTSELVGDEAAPDRGIAGGWCGSGRPPALEDAQSQPLALGDFGLGECLEL